MNDYMSDRQRLLKSIQVCDFNCHDAALYLDTHKTDKDALAYFAKHNEMVKKLKAEFCEKYGPIEVSDQTSLDVWHWTDGPWPWEHSAN